MLSNATPIFLLSSERSGSTLLRVMMGRHSDIVAPSELWLLSYPDFQTWRQRKPRAIESVRELFALLGREADGAQLERDWGSLTTTQVFARLLQLCPPGRRLLDKTPGYANSVEALERSREFAPFYIWLVRHPLGVIDSHLGVHRKKHGSWRPRDVAWRFAHSIESAWSRGMTRNARVREQKWVTQNINISRFLDTVGPQHWTMVRFEEFVSAPEQSVRRVCEAMGLPFEPEMMDHQRPQKIVPGLGDMNFHEHAGVDAHTAWRWRQQFSEELLNRDTKSLMRRLGLCYGERVISDCQGR